jgi:hypothetical protein
MDMLGVMLALYDRIHSRPTHSLAAVHQPLIVCIELRCPT